ncbi:MAG: hypothetical protein M3N47_15160 [Chloroflexota bacterium]|nr:hypothetical protein [Chloroflexota bacterium]
MGVLRGSATAGDAATYHAHDAIMRLVAIAEEFSIGRFVDAIEPLLPSDAIVSSLSEAELDRSGESWHKRNALWKTYKSVNVTTFPQDKELQAYIQARNAITHGLGGLTRRQIRRRAATAAELRHANIALRGNALLLGAADVEACAAVVKHSSLGSTATADDRKGHGEHARHNQLAPAATAVAVGGARGLGTRGSDRRLCAILIAAVVRVAHGAYVSLDNLEKRFALLQKIYGLDEARRIAAEEIAAANPILDALDCAKTPELLEDQGKRTGAEG